MALTKADIMKRLLETGGMSCRDAKAFVNHFFEEITQALERGESVKLAGFGNFEIRDKAERPGRNPKTGEPVPVVARRVTTFKASQKLKRRVGGNAR